MLVKQDRVILRKDKGPRGILRGIGMLWHVPRTWSSQRKCRIVCGIGSVPQRLNCRQWREYVQFATLIVCATLLVLALWSLSDGVAPAYGQNDDPGEIRGHKPGPTPTPTPGATLPFSPLPLGDPKGLVVAAGSSPGEAHLRWTPAANATGYWVWFAKIGVPGGELSEAFSSPSAVIAVDAGQEYQFIVLAFQERAGSVVALSGWSNWATFNPSPTEGFISISAGWRHSCGIRASGGVACWALEGSELPVPAGATLQSVSAGILHTCGVDTLGYVSCWGENADGQATSPGEPFKSVGAGYSFTCGLRIDDTVLCWGDDGDSRATPPVGSFTKVSIGLYHSCGILIDGTLSCWGRDSHGQSQAPRGTFQSISAGLAHTCGVTTDGKAICWGNNSDGQSDPPDSGFQSVSAGRMHTCGIQADNSVICWGRDEFGQSTTPRGAFISIDAGLDHNCGVQTDGSVECWGYAGALETNPLPPSLASAPTAPPKGFISLSAGRSYTCGVQADGRASCWGHNGMGRPGIRDVYGSPEGANVGVGISEGVVGELQSISSGAGFVCGLKTDSTIVCGGAS